MKRSWAITRPIFGSLFLLGLLVCLIMVVLAVACFLPLVFLGMPLAMGVFGAAYALAAPSIETGQLGQLPNGAAGRGMI